MSTPTEDVVVIARKEHVSFYYLLGFNDVYPIENPSKLKDVVRDLSSKVKIIILEESLAREAGVDHMELNMGSLYPIITLVPDSIYLASEDVSRYYRRFVLKTLGFEVGE